MMKKSFLAIPLLLLQIGQISVAQTDSALKAVAVDEAEIDTNTIHFDIEPIGASSNRYANDPQTEQITQLVQLMAGPLWTDASNTINNSGKVLRDVLRAANRHGLNPNDYWNLELEQMYNEALNGQGANYEANATYYLIRYLNHLTGGRINPEKVDPKNLKFKMRAFKDFDVLATILRTGGSGLSYYAETIAPHLPQYRYLMQNLARLTNLKNQGTWKKIAAPSKSISMGSKNPVIADIRTQLANLGYENTGTSSTFDESFDRVTKTFIRSTGASSRIDSLFWRNLNKTADDYIGQVSLNMEKLRWIPRDARDRYVFVNLAAQELTFMQQSRAFMRFRTINGRLDRQTPSMHQEIKDVILNPTWTVPLSLTMSDKLPTIYKNPQYFYDQDFYAMDRKTKRLIGDMRAIDWRGFSSETSKTKYYLVQGPGNHNALGVIKFPLRDINGSRNDEDIYLHDTNERHLFNELDRYRSSGCVRLQYPMEFAAELLRDRGISKESIINRTPWLNRSMRITVDNMNEYVRLSSPVAVYLMYMTADQNFDGSIRTFEDAYGQDKKVLAALRSGK